MESPSNDQFYRGLLTIFFVVCCNPQYTYCNINRSTFDLITSTLYRDVKFMFDRPEQMNVDSIFALSFVEVHIAAVIRYHNSDFLNNKNRLMLENVLELSRKARIDGQNVLSKSAFEQMVRPEIWNRSIFWRRGDLNRNLSITPGLTESKVISSIYQGTPQEVDSSRCLSELLKNYEDSDCTVSEVCSEMLVKNDTTRGYPLTHRLLYVQSSIALGCKENDKSSFPSLKKDYCTRIYQDLIDAEAINFPPPSSDLAMEQIFLCGMEGYMEFANSHYAELIASWPNSFGCYSAFGFNRRSKLRIRRSTDAMDHGCDNHASGVAAASLSLLIRAAVENYNHGFQS